MIQKKTKQRGLVTRHQTADSKNLKMGHKIYDLRFKNSKPKKERHSQLSTLHPPFSTTSGSIMMQVLVSLFILSMGLSGALAVIIASIEANKTNEYRMIATNLAQEGIEAVRSIRDTNWLAYSSSLRECWNYWEDRSEDGVVTDTEAAGCTPDANGQNDHPWTSTTEGADPNAIVDFDPDTFRWKLIPSVRFDNEDVSLDYGNETEFGDKDAGYKLYKKEIDGATFYTHDRTDATASVFSRKIEMYYIDNSVLDPFDDSTEPISGGSFPVGQADQDNRMLVISTVLWTQRGREHQIVMSTVMTDFYSRYEWES